MENLKTSPHNIRECDIMTDNELLLAISNMLDPIKEDIQGIKEDIRRIKEEVQEVKEDLQETKDKVRKIELVQENVILPQLNTIESCYISVYGRYKDNVDYESMKQDISIIKKVVAEHSEKLQKIS